MNRSLHRYFLLVNATFLNAFLFPFASYCAGKGSASSGHSKRFTTNLNGFGLHIPSLRASTSQCIHLLHRADLL